MAPKKKPVDKVWVTLNPWWKGDAVKYDLPYFAHETMDPAIYPWKVGKPTINTFQLKMGAKNNYIQDEDWDESSADESAVTKITPAKGKNLALPSDHKDSAKRLKINGGHAATAKKVTWDMDSDDEIIVSMKEAGRTEKEIADRLANEGRIRYHAKTIGTRWARLKKAIQAHQDELMDADMTDWHEGDDDILEQAIAKADREIQIQIEKIQEQKWRKVSDNMKALKPVTNFSPRACTERHDALRDGTAKIPPELIENKTPEILERIKTRKDREEKLASFKAGFLNSGKGSKSKMSTSGGANKRAKIAKTGAQDEGHLLMGSSSSPAADSPRPSIPLRSRSTRLSAAAATIAASRLPNAAAEPTEMRMDGASDDRRDSSSSSSGDALFFDEDKGEHYGSDAYAMDIGSEPSSSDHSEFDPRGE